MLVTLTLRYRLQPTIHQIDQNNLFFAAVIPAALGVTSAVIIASIVLAAVITPVTVRTAQQHGPRSYFLVIKEGLHLPIPF